MEKDIEKDSNDPESKSEIWSDDYLVSRLKEHLGSVTLSNNKFRTGELNDERVFDSRKYYNQAYQFLKIGASPARQAPSYLIDISDLSSDLIKELARLDLADRKFVLKQAVWRLFEDINATLYHNSISKSLNARLVDSVSIENIENEEKAKCREILKNELVSDQTEANSETKVCSVSTALRLHKGPVKIQGNDLGSFTTF